MQDFNPSKPTTEQGLYRRYGKIERIDGKSDGPNAEYLVIRIDDLASKPGSPEAAGVLAYARTVATKYPVFAAELLSKLPPAEHETAGLAKRVSELESNLVDLIGATADAIMRLDSHGLLRMLDTIRAPKAA